MESRPHIIYTNLFTLEGRDVKSNKYIDMFYIWLGNIVKYGKLNDNDLIMAFIDSKTRDCVKENPIFNLLNKKFFGLVCNQPKTIKEGMMMRYNIEYILEHNKGIEHLNPIYIYLDIDVLVVSDIHKLFSIIDESKTNIFLKQEGEINDDCHYGELITNEEKGAIKMPGFTSGIYAWSVSKDILLFMNYIREYAARCSKDLYTIDQPFFNASIFHYLICLNDPRFNFKMFNNEQIAYNIFRGHILPGKILISCGGNPGDGQFHWDKILCQVISQYLFPDWTVTSS